MKRNLSLFQAIDPFLRQMAADGRAALSIRSYRRELLLFAQAVSNIPIRCVTIDRLNAHITSPQVQLNSEGTPKGASTVNRVKSVIRAFFGWCQKTGLIDRNPAVHVRLAMAGSAVTPHMTRVEVGGFLRVIRQSRHTLACRDYALFATLAYTGIRLSDVIGLCRNDVDLAQRQLLLRRTKGGKREVRPLPVRLATILSRHIRSCRPVKTSDGESLFPNGHGRALSPRAVQYRFAMWSHRARIQKPLSVHSLRHTFGTLLYKSTKDLLLVSRALGHRDVKSTLRYAHLDDHVLAKAINKMW